VAADFIVFPANGNTVDNNETTFSGSGVVAGEAVIDYGSIDTRDIKLVTRMFYTQAEFGTNGAMTMVYQISNDGVNFFDPVTSSPTFQTLAVFPGGDMMGGGIIDSGIVTYDDPNSQSFRFVKITLTSTGTASSRNWQIYQVTESDVGANQVTVRVRSSATQDAADGTVLISDQVMNENEILTFTTELLLTGAGEFITVELPELIFNCFIPIRKPELAFIVAPPENLAVLADTV